MEKKIWLVAIFVLTAGFVFYSAEVQAHIWEDHVWQSSALNPLYFYQGSMEAEWTTAVNAWNTPSLVSGDFARTYDPEEMYFTAYEVDYGFPVQWLGQTSGYNSSGYWVYGTVEINVHYVNTSDEYRCVSMHELGHIWGLANEPLYEHSIMNVESVLEHNFEFTSPDASDISNVNFIYD